MDKKQITIKEIAVKSGVSVSTVSRVLNNKPSVDPVKRERIQRVIDELGYQPSMFARGMISKKTNTLAIIVPDITNPYFTSLIFEIEQYSKNLGYSLLLISTMTAGINRVPNGGSIETNAFKTILEKQVDGVIILGGEIDKTNVDNGYLNALNQLNSQVPIVIIGQTHPGCDCFFVQRNLEKGVQLLTHHFLALGHKRIGFIGGEPGVKITEERVAAFKKTLSIYTEVNEAYIILNDYYIEDGYRAVNLLLEQEIQLPTALIAINDMIAAGAVRALADAGLCCPGDMKIASCDRFFNSEYQVPRITTIDQHNEYLGAVAVKKLVSMIDSEETVISMHHDPELLIRESCGTHQKGEPLCINT